MIKERVKHLLSPGAAGRPSPQGFLALLANVSTGMSGTASARHI